MANKKREPLVTGGDLENRVRLAMAQTEKQFGLGTVSILGKGAKPVPIARVDSGSHYLNDILGGGYPKGRITEIIGPESSGKTTVSLHAVAEAQKADPERYVLYVDSEHALDIVYAQALGVDLSRLILAQPDTGEQALQIIELWLEQDVISMYVLDSVAAMIPKAELEGNIGDNHVGLLARLMSQGLRKIARLTYRTGTIGIFINQLREKVGVMFGNPETTPGGRALKFYASVRLDIRPKDIIKQGDMPVSRETQITIIKTKVSSPHQKILVDIEFGKGISRAGEIIDIGSDLGLINKSGNWYSYKDIIKENGRSKMKEALESHPEVMAELNELITVMNSPFTEDEIIEEPELGELPDGLLAEEEKEMQNEHEEVGEAS
ncbi:recombinase RecA [Paenibacillus xylanexedens]|uniref:recombinase RecA n=1 Tax=Paenibacillus xylanexedens TaxID=528191 RepID=UPI000F90F425|nr:recombinase RecA [Paenibacillus xylanexedens]RPK20037.1 hypothetical protein EDO6_06554 [Paenibacillus xylanexedens]